jgi:hypothetical protein
MVENVHDGILIAFCHGTYLKRHGGSPPVAWLNQVMIVEQGIIMNESGAIFNGFFQPFLMLTYLNKNNNKRPSMRKARLLHGGMAPGAVGFILKWITFSYEHQKGGSWNFFFSR